MHSASVSSNWFSNAGLRATVSSLISKLPFELLSRVARGSPFENTLKAFDGQLLVSSWVSKGLLGGLHSRILLYKAFEGHLLVSSWVFEG